MNKQEIIEFYLRSFTLDADKPAHKLNKKNINKDEIKKVLDEAGLFTISSRLNYIWSLDYAIENTVIKNIHLSDELLITNKINNKMEELFPNLKISEESFKNILNNRYIKSINSMRALAAICHGDINTFNDYDKENKHLLANYIIKTLVLSNMNCNDIQNKFDEIKEITNDNRKFHPIDNILKFAWNFDEDILNEFKEFMKDKKEVYTEGVLNILKDCIKNEDSFNQILVSKLESQENSADLIEIDINELSIEPKMEEVTTDVKDEIYMDYNKQSIKLIIKEKLMKSLSLLEELNEEDNSNIVEEIKAKNEELENENKRLKHEIEVLKSKISSTSLKEFIQKMGGPEFGYQLTDLYLLSEDILEDDGNIPGRLLNMFSLLEMYNIEPYTAGKLIGEEFEIGLKELGPNYNLEVPIRSKEDKVKVKIVKYGWKQNNTVIVSPLVKQII